MLHRIVQNGTPMIVIQTTDAVASTYRTCDICGKKITGAYYKIHGLTVENPKRSISNDICSHCMSDFDMLKDKYFNKISRLYVTRCLDPNHESHMSVSSYNPYHSFMDYDDKVEENHQKSEITDAARNFLEFVAKTAKQLGIKVEEVTFDEDDE